MYKFCIRIKRLILSFCERLDADPCTKINRNMQSKSMKGRWKSLSRKAICLEAHCSVTQPSSRKNNGSLFSLIPVSSNSLRSLDPRGHPDQLKSAPEAADLGKWEEIGNRFR